MNPSRRAGCVLFVVVALCFSSHVRAADNGPVTLEDIHKVLVQAAGEVGSPPPAAQQKQLLAEALKMIRHAPMDAHRPLRQATREIEGALEQLSRGKLPDYLIK